MRPRTFLLLLAALAACAPARPAAAQPVSVRANVDAETIGRQDEVIYSIEVSGERFGTVQTPEAPRTQGLTLVQPYPSTQRTASLTNGVMKQALLFRWRYRPLREGTARIESATIKIGGETHTTDPIEVRVVAQSTSPGRRTPPAGRGGAVPEESSAVSQRDIFIEATPSKTVAYQNEAVVVQYRLFFRLGFQFRQLRLADSWDAVGFWREEMDVDSNPIPETVTRDGERYQSIVLKRVALFATRSGTLSVDPLSVEADLYAPRRSRDPFGMWGGRGALETVRIVSPPLRLRIQPLPEGAPESFSGAVGRFRLNAFYDRTALEVGESTTLRVTISGSGNLSTLTPPDLQPPGAVEVYTPTSTADVSRSPSGVSGSRTFDYVLVPHANGSFEVPPVRFTFFDPQQRRYETLSSDGVTLIVTGEAPAGSDALPADGIAGLITTPGRWVQVQPVLLHRQAWPYMLLAFPMLALAALAVVRRRHRRLAADSVLARSRAAHPLARKHLRAATGCLEKGDARAFYDAIERALLGFVGARFNVAERGLTRQALGDRLAAVNVPETTTARLFSLLERCDRVRFAPVVPDRHAQQADREEAAALIVELDTALSSRAA